MSYQVTVRYSDGAVRLLPVLAGQTVLEAAEASGVPIVSECRSGICGTCVGRCTQGSYAMAHAVGLSQQEKEQGRILTCQTQVESDCTIEVDYPLSGNAAHIVVGDAVVSSIDRLSPDTVLLALDASNLPEPLAFKPGQFAQLRVPGTDQWRSYSFAHATRVDAHVEFLVRLLPAGVMSDYLRSRAGVGDRIEVRGAKGGFFLRDARRPVLLVAGGTGLSAILAIAEQLVRESGTRPVRLNYGVARDVDLVLTRRLDELARQHPNFTWHSIVQVPSPAWRGRVGVVTELLDECALDGGDVDIYLCGPSGMVTATRRWLQEHGHSAANVYCERFVASGNRRADAAAAPGSVDVGLVREQGRGVAVVIGGSIAGMSAAKVLTEFFDRVIVLEKDADHRRGEGRPGAAQGWHLHHLLIAGQKKLDSIFPGIIDDMVAAGAFKVDMGEQYRIMLAGSWKKVGPTDVEIVCAGRPLLEWCVRRRLDLESRIEYRYETEAVDLTIDESSLEVLGVAARSEGVREVIAAEFVVDAAGKNTPLPAILKRLGIGSPAVEDDCLNCFYSTMQHRVPPGRAWRDKVMVICYAHRPQQQHYAAQYFTDSSRTILSTSLVGYDCHRPPRNATEFREFARLMPSQSIGDELDGLEPCSAVHNFRYPEMRRFLYEDMRNLPAGLVSVGDAYCSADPVSGAGMTKALLELDELRGLLRSRNVGDQRFVQEYYDRVRRIADRVWFVVREQNLRYPWIKDVEVKRPFYFRAHNWYVDRVFELLHEDPGIYRLYLLVTHFVEPPSALLRPVVAARVIGRWLRTRLAFKQTLIERNFGEGRAGESHATIP